MKGLDVKEESHVPLEDAPPQPRSPGSKKRFAFFFVLGAMFWLVVRHAPISIHHCGGHRHHRAGVPHGALGLMDHMRTSIRKDVPMCQLRGYADAAMCRSTFEQRNAAAEAAFLEVPKAKSAREALKRYTSVHHLAGEQNDYQSALRVIREWSEHLGLGAPENPTEKVFDAGTPEARHHMIGDWQMDGNRTGIRVWADSYTVWLDQPVSSSLFLAPPNRSDDPSPEATWVADLREDVLKEDPTSKHGLPPFHGYSFSGNASGRVVFAGAGRKEDFDLLANRGVSLKGRIALVKYGGLFRGLKVRAAQEAGAVGVLIYTDPQEDGKVTEAQGHTAYPDGPARQPSSVQRGSVQAFSFYPGDPGTPGEPSYRNATRLPIEEADSLPHIPSLPISWKNAQEILRTIQGEGIRSAEVHPSMPGAIPDVEYWTGPSAEIAHMDNRMDLKPRDIWNVYAVIPGYIEDERVIVGNHRDAWTFGAADPSSGTAVMHEVVRGLGELVKTGWRPLRTLVIASWDAEEYGLVGSTEFGEDYADHLSRNAAVYLNLDVAVAGSKLETHASPSLALLLREAAASVRMGDTGEPIKVHEVQPVGSGSDYTVFLQRLGIASSDISFKRRASDPVYHYHSNFDSFHWMDKFGDPGFVRHEALAKMLGLMVLRCVQPALLPLDTVGYAREMIGYYKQLIRTARTANTPVDLDALRMVRIEHAVLDVERAAIGLEHRQDHLYHRFLQLSEKARSHPDQNLERRLWSVMHKLHRANVRLRDFERGFIDKAGLRGRTWYRHVGVAPGRWLGYGATTFPGVTEAFTLDNGDHAAEEVERLIVRLRSIARRLYW